MKILNISLLFILLALTATASQYKGHVSFENRVLKEQNDSLFLSFDIHIQANAVKDCQSLLVTPLLETDDNSLQFPYIQINGNNKRQMIKRWESLNGKNRLYERPYVLKNIQGSETDTLIYYTIEIPYEQWMDSASFYIVEEFWDCAGEKRLYTFMMNNKVELESKEPYQPSALVNFILPPAEEKQRKMQGQAFLDFHVGQSVIIPTYRRNPEELAKIRETVDEVRNNTDVNITGLYIEGYASPEGSYATNDRLSRERANALKEYMQTNFGIPQSQFTVSSVAEDWNGLKALVQQSDIAQKERILSIIDSDTDYDRKEQQIKALGAPYRTMLTEMFPQLRRVEYQVNYTVKDYTTDEAKDLVGKRPEQLSQRELFLVAQTYPQGSTEYNNILETIIRLYPDDPIANLNAAALMLSRGENTTAKRYLDKAGISSDSYNNWGVYYLNTGELDKAQENFTKAASVGNQEATHNLNEVKLKAKDNERMERYHKR